MSGSNNDNDKKIRERILAEKKLERGTHTIPAPRMLHPSSNKNNFSVKQPPPDPK